VGTGGAGRGGAAATVVAGRAGAMGCGGALATMGCGAGSAAGFAEAATAAAAATTLGVAFAGALSDAFRARVMSFPLRRCPYLPERQARSQIHELSRNTSSSSVR
jgi:hypothetical protein